MPPPPPSVFSRGGSLLLLLLLLFMLTAALLIGILYRYADGGNHTSAGCLWGISDQKAYYFFLGVFTLTLAPFAYFEISKTKLLQMFTTVMRYATFFMLMSLCIVGVAHPDPFAGG